MVFSKLFVPKEERNKAAQESANAKFATTDLSKYKHIVTKISVWNSSVGDTSNPDSILKKLKQGDVLEIHQTRNRGKQELFISTVYGRDIGTLLQSLTDDLTFKRDYGPDGDSDYDDSKWFYLIQGFPVVKSISIAPRNKKNIKLKLISIISKRKIGDYIDLNPKNFVNRNVSHEMVK
jgi:hypothetical protein